ncbi:Gfo/Idh/MocA family protein [Peribacillus alkalitolerans]|uniref:Gfo/Idh/MocA family protein n=1 Tax=Peribacillus alkalitolerans TaxID=1550385 RepID=UPI0013D6D2F2|nr:Gfo/Idh/MocA family oxidoreductase [Peribacillus alkalitolerans]
MNLIRIGVVGTGKMGTYHCSKLKQMKNVDFVGVFDKDLKRAEEISRKLGVTAFKSYQELLENVDAVVIAAPTKLHFLLVEEAIKAQRHILVEKPITVSMEEANHIKGLLKGQDLIFQVGHIERFNPAVQQLAKCIDREKIISIEAKRVGLSNRIQDSDVILDVMIHDLDIILDIVKSPIARASAEGVCGSETNHFETVTALLSFENGVIASVTASYASHEKERTLTILEKEKVIKTDYLTRRQKIVRNRTGAAGQPFEIESEISILATPILDPLLEELEHFVDCIRKKKQPIIGVEEGAAAVEAALKIKGFLKKNN